MKQINRKPGHVPGRILVAAVLVSMASMNAQAQDPSLEKLSETQRLQRLERMLDSDLLRQQSQTIQRAQRVIGNNQYTPFGRYIQPVAVGNPE